MAIGTATMYTAINPSTLYGIKNTKIVNSANTSTVKDRSFSFIKPFKLILIVLLYFKMYPCPLLVSIKSCKSTSSSFVLSLFIFTVRVLSSIKLSLSHK